MEINSVPASISEEELKLSICKVLLTRHEVKPDKLQACHHVKKKEIIVVMIYSDLFPFFKNVEFWVIRGVGKRAKMSKMTKKNQYNYICRMN